MRNLAGLRFLRDGSVGGTTRAARSLAASACNRLRRHLGRSGSPMGRREARQTLPATATGGITLPPVLPGAGRWALPWEAELGSPAHAGSALTARGVVDPPIHPGSPPAPSHPSSTSSTTSSTRCRASVWRRLACGIHSSCPCTQARNTCMYLYWPPPRRGRRQSRARLGSFSPAHGRTFHVSDRPTYHDGMGQRGARTGFVADAGQRNMEPARLPTHLPTCLPTYPPTWCPPGCCLRVRAVSRDAVCSVLAGPSLNPSSRPMAFPEPMVGSHLSDA